MKNIVFIFVFISSIKTVSSQSIISDLAMREEELYETSFNRSNNIERIIETDTSYIFDVLIATHTFQDYNQIGFRTSSGIVLEDGSLEINLLFSYDSIGRLKLVRSPENYKSLLDSISFKYINKFQLQTITYGPLDLIIKSSIYYDSLGYPIEVFAFTNDSSLFSHEIANYNFDKNRVRLKDLTEPKHNYTIIIDSRVEEKINYKDKIYNSYGDLISYRYKFKKYIIDYQYDFKENWIYRKIYRANKKDKNPQEIKYRKIYYRD